MSLHLTGGNQIVTFPNLNGGTAQFILSNSLSGQTIDNGLRINGGLSLGTMLAPQYGGTGIDGSTAPNGSLLIGNGAGYDLTTITGTPNQITVTNVPGSITLATPQDIAPSSSPTFAALTVGANTGTGPGTGLAARIKLQDGTSADGHAATLTSLAMAADRLIAFQDPGANASVVTTEGDQTVNGNKSFTGQTGFILIKGSGENHFAGTIELTPGMLSVTVPHTGVTANSTIIVTPEDLNDKDMFDCRVSTKVPGVSFLVRFSGAVPQGANARLHYLIVNP